MGQLHLGPTRQAGAVSISGVVSCSLMEVLEVLLGIQKKKEADRGERNLTDNDKKEGNLLSSGFPFLVPCARWREISSSIVPGQFWKFVFIRFINL